LKEKNKRLDKEKEEKNMKLKWMNGENVLSQEE
jgi:hypothetical protein